MGRRSINSTKRGKYMNPTDQARKEARKKELKKNKRQRQNVRTAVLKGKDPVQLLSEMEKIDQMEFNTSQPSPLNEKVLKEKRKKLKDTFDRVMKMYEKEDTEKWNEMRAAEAEYIKARNRLVTYYEAVKSNENGENVEIPLPPMEGESFFDSLSNIPLPADDPDHPLGILRKKSAYSPSSSPHRTFLLTKAPPGVPSEPPPVLLPHEYGVEDESDSSDNGGEDNAADGIEKQKEKRTIRFVDLDSKTEENEDTNFSSAGQEIDVFMKEMEEVHKKRSANPEQMAIDEAQRNVSSHPSSMISLMPPLNVVPPHMFRPPPLIVGPGGIRLPPGPPPGRPSIIPPGPPPGLPRLGMPGMRLPMMPPSGNSRFIRFAVNPIGRPGGPRALANVVTAGPQLVTREEDIDVRHASTSATIKAKAQLRNFNAGITRFLPTSVRVKRDDKCKTTKQEGKGLLSSEEPIPYVNPTESRPTGPMVQQSKDDAYMQFMKEIGTLL